MGTPNLPNLLLPLLLLSSCSISANSPPYSLTLTTCDQPPSSASFRGLSTPGKGVVWATGSSGSIFRSLDSGGTWEPIPNPGDRDLDFRDVHSLGPNRAWLMAAGTGPASQVYQTIDGGKTWQLQLANPDSNGFFDSIAFSNQQHGFLLGDPIDGVFTIFHTINGGQNWNRLSTELSPKAATEEHCFAASGSVLVSDDAGHLFLATGGSHARVFQSDTANILSTVGANEARDDETPVTAPQSVWIDVSLPIRSGDAAQGIFSVAFRDSKVGIAVGGDYTDPENPLSICARTIDGGQTWRAVNANGPSGYRSSVAYIPHSNPPVWVAVGSHGADWSEDDGKSWLPIPGLVGYHSVSFGVDGTGMAVGSPGAPFMQLHLSR